MSNWNGKIKCTQSWCDVFIENKIYSVIDGIIYNDNLTEKITCNSYMDISDLNNFFTSQFEEVEEFKEVKVPVLCELLNIKPYEKFKIEYYPNQMFQEAYEFDENGILYCQDSNCHREQVVERLINKKYNIIKLPQYQFSKAEITILSALDLNNYKYITRDKDGNGLWAYDGMPTQRDDYYDYSGDTAYSVKLNDTFFQQVQWGNVLDIELELSKIE